MMLLWCYYDVAIVLLWCCYGVAMVLLWCYCSVAMVLLWCYCGVAMVLLWCYCGVAMSMQVLYNHIVSDIRRLNAKHRNNRVNRVSLTYILLPSTALLPRHSLYLHSTRISSPVCSTKPVTLCKIYTCYMYSVCTVTYVQHNLSAVPYSNSGFSLNNVLAPVNKCTVYTFKSRVSFTVYSHFVNSCPVLVSIRDWLLLYDGGKNYVHVPS